MRAVILVVLLYVLVVNLAALFWIISILIMSSFWFGSQTVLEYSKKRSDQCHIGSLFNWFGT